MMYYLVKVERDRTVIDVAHIYVRTESEADSPNFVKVMDAIWDANERGELPWEERESVEEGDPEIVVVGPGKHTIPDNTPCINI